MSQPVKIHPSAVVDAHAEIGVGVSIGPFAVVGPKVKLGDGVTIDSHAVVSGRTVVGARTHIHSFASVGSQPQDLKFAGEDTELVIGVENMIREYANLSVGTAGGGGKTVVGDRNLFMVYSHVAHDCVIGNDSIFANGVAIAGHCVVGDKAVFGGLSGLHQFCHVGDMAMVAAGAIVTQDVPPFVMVQGDRAKPTGLNVVGLRRSGMTAGQVSDVKNCYRLIYSEGLPIDDAVARIGVETTDQSVKSKFLVFFSAAKRGICR